MTLYHYLTCFGISSRDSVSLLNLLRYIKRNSVSLLNLLLSIKPWLCVITYLTSVNQAVTLCHYLTYFGISSRGSVSLLNICYIRTLSINNKKIGSLLKKLSRKWANHYGKAAKRDPNEKMCISGGYIPFSLLFICFLCVFLYFELIGTRVSSITHGFWVKLDWLQ